jgi:phosphoserine aminotransferase
MKLNNFSAGPSKIPVQVIRTIAEEINNYKNLGYSVLEISHRSNIFENIVNSAKEKLVQILEIPDDYDIFFLQGGATFQNTFIPTNKRSLNNNISFLISGSWGRKTHKDFETYFDNEISNFSIN